MLAEISVIPIDGGTSMGGYVAAAVKAIQSLPVKIEVTAMGTNLEGSLEDILNAFRAAHDACIREGAKRVILSLRVDDRTDREMSIEKAERSVEAHGATLH